MAEKFFSTNDGCSDITRVSGSSSSGSANSVSVSVDFGSSFTNYAETAVTGQTWVAADSEIVATPLCTGSDYMEYAVLGFKHVVHSLVAGDGFTLGVFTDVQAKGTYNFAVMGN